MAYNRVNPSELIERRIEKDNSFKNEIDIVRLQLNLVKSLAELRDELDITQDEITKKSGLTQQMVSRIERLENVPRLDSFLKYVSAMGLEIKFVKVNR